MERLTRTIIIQREEKTKEEKKKNHTPEVATGDASEFQSAAKTNERSHWWRSGSWRSSSSS